MARIQRVLIAAVSLGVVAIIAASILASGDVGHRRVVRKNPLKEPISITSIRGNTVVAENREFRLAGVAFPTEARLAARAADFLRVATAQGVEVIRPVQPDGTFMLRCEPRIWHWCGNDPVAAHYERYILNELVVAYGFATFDRGATGLTDSERQRLNAAEDLAKVDHRGIWSDGDGVADNSFGSDLGLNISHVILLYELVDPSDP